MISSTGGGDNFYFLAVPTSTGIYIEVQTGYRLSIYLLKMRLIIIHLCINILVLLMGFISSIIKANNHQVLLELLVI